VTPRHREPQRRSDRLRRELLDRPAAAYRWVEGLPWERLWLRPLLVVALLVVAGASGGSAACAAVLLDQSVEPWFWWGFAPPVALVALFGLYASWGLLSSLGLGERVRGHR